MSKRKFNVGDRVVINRKYKEKSNCTNKAGTIIYSRRFSGDKYKYTVRWDDKLFLDEYYSYELNEYVDDNYDEKRLDSNTELTPWHALKTRSERWNELCNEYLKEFCDKHEYPCEPDMWVGGDIGTIVMIGDMFVSMDNIRYDIDNNVPEYYFDKWYWKSIEISELTEGAENYMNYENYCKGAPDYWTEDRIQKICSSKKRIEEAKNELLKSIEDTRKDNF